MKKEGLNLIDSVSSYGMLNSVNQIAEAVKSWLVIEKLRCHQKRFLLWEVRKRTWRICRSNKVSRADDV